MENDHYTFIRRSEFSETYLFLLPKELSRLLDAYYFGPLEINLEYKLKTLRPYEYLKIDRFNSDNVIDTSIEIVILREIYWHSTKQIMLREGINTTIVLYLWKNNLILIKCGDCATMYLNGDYTIKIFWEKITRIAATITMLREQNLSVQQINLEVFNLVF